MLKLTRLYKVNDTIKTGSILVDPLHVVSVRPSNALGKANGHRATITLSGGQEIPVTTIFSETSAMVEAAKEDARF
jgi:hypothetical protein